MPPTKTFFRYQTTSAHLYIVDMRINVAFFTFMFAVLYDLFTLFVFVCVQCCPAHIVLCFCLVFFVLCTVNLLPVSLDFPFFIAPSVFSNVHFKLTSDKSLYYRKSLLTKEFCFCHLPKMYNISIFTIQNKNKALKTLFCFNPINN